MNDPVPNQFWSLYDKVAGEIIKEHQATPGTADESIPVGLDPSLAWLVESSDPEPPFNPNIERLTPSETITIDPADTRTGTRVFTFSKVPLSAEQLDQRAVDAVRKRNKAAVMAIAEKLRNDEVITQGEAYKLFQELALRDRMDL